MKIGLLYGGLAAGGLAIALGQMNATALPGRGDEGGVATGPDVIVGALPASAKYGSAIIGGQTIMAYSFATTSCNIGNQQLLWYDFDPDGAGPITNADHPVMPQNAYRVKGGRIEQIGMSWLKHGFCALQGTVCGSCTPAGSGCPNLLGVGCSDPYDASLNGTQSGLGPRSQVNASTGVFPFPFTAPAIPPAEAAIGRRCQINANDLDPAQNAGAIYFCEGQYVHRQDAASGNNANNASYRKMTVGTLSSGAYALNLTGSTIQQKPAIWGWKDVDPSVTILPVDGPDGRYVIGYRVTDNGNGTWHYEYAIYNVSSDSSGASFTLPLPNGVTVTNQAFRDIAYHSGEPYNSIDWSMTTSLNQVRWACTQTFAQTPNANALRFATMYNFRFDANTAPTSATATIGLFKTGASFNFVGLAPAAPSVLGDLNGDLIVDGADLGILLSNWGMNGLGDLNADHTVDGADLGILLGAWTI